MSDSAPPELRLEDFLTEQQKAMLQQLRENTRVKNVFYEQQEILREANRKRFLASGKPTIRLSRGRLSRGKWVASWKWGPYRQQCKTFDHACLRAKVWWEREWNRCGEP